MTDTVTDDEDDSDNRRFEEKDAAAALAAATKKAAAAAPAPKMNKFVHYPMPMTAAMAEQAAADLAVDVAAHGDVAWAARETQDTVRALATLFAMKGGRARNCAYK